MGQFWSYSGQLARPHGPWSDEAGLIAFIWPWVGPQSQEYTNMGSWDGWVGTGYSPPSTLPGPIPRVHPPTHPSTRSRVRAGPSHGANMAVGLKSVEQLTLEAHFSEMRGITEVYNLATADNPNDHNLIPGFD